MDVQALGSAVIVAPQADPAQSQNQANNSSPDAPGIAGASGTVLSSSVTPKSAAAAEAAPQDALKKIVPLKAGTSSVHPLAPQTPSTAIHVSYRFVQNPVQVVVVFTDAADGQQIAQVPPEFVVKLVQFDHDKGELVDRDA